MNRQFSIHRRRVNLIDLIANNVDGVSEYRFKWATNFDVAPVQFLASTLNGYLDPSINSAVLEYLNLGRRLRVSFNPATFGIPDTKPFWLSLFHYNGVETQVTAPTLVMPDTISTLSRLGAMVMIRGTIPVAASVDNSLQLDLPRRMIEFRILNEGANPLFVAVDAGGYEIRIAPLAEHTSIKASASSLWLRTTGGTTTASITCTVANS